MKLSLSKPVIVVALFFTGLVLLFFVTREVDHYERLDSLSQEFNDNPSEDNLRRLINYPSDSVYSYYHVALIGQSFAKHPNSYKVLSEDLSSDRERFWINTLASLGDDVFQYYPELEADDFDRCFEDNKGWLQKQKKPNKTLHTNP